MPASSPERPRRAARMREERRAQIIAAAKEVFAERGYHRASVGDVIERAGIARGTFYLYFTGKSDVFERLLGEALLALRSRIRPIETGRRASPPEAQLRAMLRAILEQALADRHFTRLLLTLWLNPDVEVAASVDAFYAQVRDLVARSLERGRRMGLVRPCDPALLAPMLLGAARGTIGHLLAAERVPPLDRVVDALVGLVIHGAGVSGRWR